MSGTFTSFYKAVIDGAEEELPSLSAGVVRGGEEEGLELELKTNNYNNLLYVWDKVGHLIYCILMPSDVFYGVRYR